MNADQLKKAVAETLRGVDVVIAFGQGFDAAHGEPRFVTRAEEVEGLILNPLCEHNLASFLPSRKNKKTGVVVKGCDSRTIVQFLQEGLVKRENLVIIGVPCKGVASAKKLARALDHQSVDSLSFEGDTIVAHTPRGEKRIALADVSPDKCRTCQYPTPLIYDVLVGEPIESDKDPSEVYGDIKELDGEVPGREEGLLGKRDQPVHALLRVPQRLPLMRLPGFLHRRDPRPPLAEPALDSEREDDVPSDPCHPSRRAVHGMRRVRARLPHEHPFG